MLIGALPAIVIVWEIFYFTDMLRVDTLLYILIKGLFFLLLIYWFKSEKVFCQNFLSKHSEALSRLGVIACIQAVVFLLIYLFTDL